MTPDPNIERLRDLIEWGQEVGLTDDAIERYEVALAAVSANLERADRLRDDYSRLVHDAAQCAADLEAAKAALRSLRDAWNAHMATCPQPPVDIPAPTFEQFDAWMNAPSNTASALAAPDSEPTQFCGRDDLVPHRWHHWRRMADGSYGDYDDDGVLMRCPGLVAPDPEGDDRG